MAFTHTKTPTFTHTHARTLGTDEGVVHGLQLCWVEVCAVEGEDLPERLLGLLLDCHHAVVFRSVVGLVLPRATDWARSQHRKYETEQASRDKWRELLLLLARPIGESHVAVEAARSERSACFNRDRTNTPTGARVQCAGCR